MKEIFLCADLHMGHENIIGYTNRPFTDADHMNEILIQNFNSVIKYGDDVYCMGDFAFHNHQQYLKRLNGNWFLIKGNHDKGCEQANFAWVKDTYTLNMGKTDCIYMSHYAHRVWNRSHFNSYHAFGHSHGRVEPYGRSMDVGVDAVPNKYFPIHLEEFIKILSKENNPNLVQGR
jgi:calcineurin-like phosphoesterase family protein